MNLMLGMLKQLKYLGVRSEFMLVLFHLLSVQMMMKLLPRTKKKERLENLALKSSSFSSATISTVG